MLSLAGFFALLIVGSIIHQTGLDEYVAPALPALGLFLVAWGWKAIRQARECRREHLQRPPLSRDELRVARSKLMNDRKAKNDYSDYHC